MNRYTALFSSILLLILITGCFSRLALYDGPYEGKVVDADTREPIEGVVILGTWHKKTPTVAGSVSSFYDAYETVTDDKGEFYFSGQGPRVMSNLEPMRIRIFKAGYEYFEAGWDSLDYDLILKRKIKWEGSKPIIPLKKLTMDERKKRGTPSSPPSKAPLDKVIIMLREIDKERIALGLDRRRIWGGKEYD